MKRVKEDSESEQKRGLEVKRKVLSQSLNEDEHNLHFQ